MSDEDHELAMLKAKRLAEMQKNITSQAKPQPTAEPKKTQSFRDTLIPKLGYRGMEVLQNAERQFPNETKMIVDKLGELIQTGEINEELDGGKLLALFRSVGISVRMETKINVEQDGKFVSLSDKLTTKPDDSND
jgi:DNA-binding TFAR19-related protein (PDSD5 family)